VPSVNCFGFVIPLCSRVLGRGASGNEGTGTGAAKGVAGAGDPPGVEDPDVEDPDPPLAASGGFASVSVPPPLAATGATWQIQAGPKRTRCPHAAREERP
jgi:hypothetical protein